MSVFIYCKNKNAIVLKDNCVKCPMFEECEDAKLGGFDNPIDAMGEILFGGGSKDGKPERSEREVLQGRGGD